MPRLNLLIKFCSLTILSALIMPVYAYETSVSPVKSDVVAQTSEEDAKVTDTVKKLIHGSKTLSNLNIQVATDKGVVSLTGQVDSEAQASSLIEAAESVIGVKNVDTSNLTVKDSSQPLADAYITAKVKGLFIREKLFTQKDILAMNMSVETKDGVVYLTGVVDNNEQIKNAIAVIQKNLPEVKKVEYSVKKITPAH